MSASIRWAPIRPDHRSLGVGAPQAFMGALGEVGIDLPCELTREHLNTLKAMAAAVGRGVDENPYRDLVELIEKHDIIRIWAEY